MRHLRTDHGRFRTDFRTADSRLAPLLQETPASERL